MDSNLLMSVKIGFDLLLEAFDPCVTMEPLQNPSLASTSFSDELLSVEQLRFSLALRLSLL